ncbi:MAG: hypothetical protein ACRC2V_01200 [Xenococcaceae cyanobacterium]
MKKLLCTIFGGSVIDKKFLAKLVHFKNGNIYEVEELDRYLEAVETALQDSNVCVFSKDFFDGLMFCHLVLHVLSNLKEEEKKFLVKTLKIQKDKEIEKNLELDDIPF